MFPLSFNEYFEWRKNGMKRTLIRYSRFPIYTDKGMHLCIDTKRRHWQFSIGMSTCVKHPREDETK